MDETSSPIPSLDLLEAELVRALYKRNDCNRLKNAQNVLERYSGIDWIPHQRCPRFDGYTALGYQRVCVKRHNDLFDLLVLSWAPGTKSPIHDHPCERCFLMCVSGSLYEDRYVLDDEEKPVFHRRTPIPPRVATWISDDIGIHSVGNDGDTVACSLHCYIPGFTTPCTLYDNETLVQSKATMVPIPPSEANLSATVLRQVEQYMNDFDSLSDQRVSPTQEPLDIETAFRKSRCPLDFGNSALPCDDHAIGAAVRLASDLSVHTSHRFFFNQLLTKADPLASSADALASIMNVNMHDFENAPVLTLMEKYMLENLARHVGWTPDECADGRADKWFDGIFLPGASLGNLTAMHAAREWFKASRKGSLAEGNKLVAFTSVESHQSISKACNILGLGPSSCQYVPCDEYTGMISIRHLRLALTKSIEHGFTPFFLNCTAGSTHSGSFDDCEAMAALASEFGCWLHVDGALGASFLLPKEEPFTTLTRGIHKANSLSWNLHKLLGIPLPCSVLLAREPHVLASAYGSGVDTIRRSDDSILSSRRADGLKAWVLWKKMGDIGMANRVRLTYMHNLDLARMIREYPCKFSIDNPTVPDEVDEPEDQNRGAFHLAYQPTSACTCFYWVPPSLRERFINEGPQSLRTELGVIATRMKARLLQDGVMMISHFSTDSRPHFWRIPNIHQSMSQSSMWQILKTINRVGSELFPAALRSDTPLDMSSGDHQNLKTGMTSEVGLGFDCDQRRSA
jgi:glutamate/tyrosine decarboxylase-like PLP-dependent enzyme/predicted metal-dependent enzyme (double-stranded beta helix superfamily)